MGAANYHLFRSGRVWHVRFQVDGRRTQLSTKETDRQRAEKVAERAWRKAALWSRDGKEIPTLRELIKMWLEVHTPTVSTSHAKIVETFGRLHLFGLADIEIDLITTQMVEAARLEWLKTRSPVSANQSLKVLRLLCGWAIKRGMLPAMPFQVRALKVQKRVRAVLPTALVQDWLAAIDKREGERLGVRVAVRLALGVALREAECRSARWEWYDSERRLYTPGVTKGKENPTALPVPDWLFDFLEPLRKPSGLVIARPDGRPYPAGFTRNAMLEANKAVGAPHITAHRLRGSLATLLSENGVPAQDVQTLLRHSSITTTSLYLTTNMDRVARGQARIADKIGFGLRIETDGAPMARDASEAATG
ncbi:tyrosine-type recombinase/integrase [Paraburkholderia sp.]|uniref:tyrosine-type recombinase/integrase n=1 Tax=Paraburkholderia sp. TaxID=1926495 RepID=UPI003C7BD58D